jgi:5-methylcytosine-specific restriction enzyme B
MDIFSRIATIESKSPVDAPTVDVTFVVSNTRGSRFPYRGRDVLEILKALLNNIDDFIALGEVFEQNPWRAAFNEHLKDTIRTSSGNQTISVFSLIAKLIWVANGDRGEFNDNKVVLSRERVLKAIDQVREAISIYTGSAARASAKDADLQVETIDLDILAATSQSLSTEPTVVKGGDNILFTGSPGTGKSYLAEQIAKSGEHVFQCCFNSNSSYAEFFGSTTAASNADRSATLFDFTPGIFLRAYACARLNPCSAVYLVIDEINRADTMAVIGNLFQLLEREADGTGRYEIDTSLRGAYDYLKQSGVDNPEKLRIPSNLTILATMNAGDQNVRSLDTAFYRRFLVKQVRIDEDLAPDREIRIMDETGSAFMISYRSFLKVLNGFISKDLGLHEDRRVGQFYVRDSHFSSDKTMPFTILFYLYQGLKGVGQRGVFGNLFHTADDLWSAAHNGKQVFSPEFIRKLRAASVSGVTV